MAVISVKTLHDGWSGTFPQNEAPTFKVVYLVEVDDPQDGNMTVVSASGIPALGTAYRVGQDFRPDVLLKSLSTSPVAGTRNLWQVTASYGAGEKGEPPETGDPTDGKTQEGEDTEDPLKFAVSLSLSTTRHTHDAVNGTYVGQYQDGVFFDDRGFVNHDHPPVPQAFVEHNRNNGQITNARAITNSVFRPFDPPPQVEYNRTNVKIKWNSLNTPKKIARYVNSVNKKFILIRINYHWADELGIDRVSTGQVYVPQFAGRIMGLQSSPAMTADGIGYHDNELEIEVDKLYTWRMDVLDRGYATLNMAQSFPTAGIDGVTVTDGDVTEDGFGNREPALLDGKGQKLNVKKSEGCFLRYGVYPEMEWRDIKLDQLHMIGDFE
jgi:hypothetical protein